MNTNGQTNLTKTLFDCSSISQSKFGGCNMTETSFKNAELFETVFYSCSMVKTIFQGATVTSCIFVDCEAYEIDLRGTTFTNCRFINFIFKDGKSLVDNTTIFSHVTFEGTTDLSKLYLNGAKMESVLNMSNTSWMTEPPTDDINIDLIDISHFNLSGDVQNTHADHTG